MAGVVEPAYELRCSCNSYPWGKQGSDSLAARLCAKQPGWAEDGGKGEFKIDESKSYAEMWMGTYPVLPSYVADSGEDLQDLIDRNPKALLGEQSIIKFGHAKLPYLPKILSIAKALPLQLHPNRTLAKELHQQNPDAFTDPNHKPEIAVALTEFEAFCGWKPLKQIEALMKLEPLQRFNTKIQKPTFDDQQLKGVVRNMLLADSKVINSTCTALTSLPTDAFAEHDAHIQKLARRLADQHGASDPGVLVALITMNYLVLQPGEALYIPADGIHAYLAGDIIECMARSNNVLSTGFCPAAERSNVDTFCATLTFSPHDRAESMLHPQRYGRSREGKTLLYAPPVSEFDVLATALRAGEREGLGAVGGPSVLVATRGSAVMDVAGKTCIVREGGVWFVAPGKDIYVEAGREGLDMYVAFVD